METKAKVHYGWVVCIACTLIMFCCTGLIINAFSVYMPYLVERYGLTQTQASLITTFRSLFSLIFKFVVLWFINKLDVCRTMTIGFLCTTVAFVCYSFSKSVVGIYVAASLSGIGYGLATMVPISILLNRWFKEKLALAVAICAASTGVASMIFPAIVTMVIESYGLATAFLAEGAVVFVLCTLAVIMLRNHPEDIGISPFGAMEGRNGELKKAAGVAAEEAKPLSKLHELVFLIAPLFLGAVCTTLPGLFTLHFTGQGYNSMTAALAVSTYGFTLLLGKFAYGFLSDEVGGSKTNFIFLLLQILGLALGCIIKGHEVFLFASVVLIGLGASVSTVGITMWARDFPMSSGYEHTVRLYQILFMLGSMLVSPITGIIADKTGSYVMVYAGFGMMSVIILLIVLASYRIKNTVREATN